MNNCIHTYGVAYYYPTWINGITQTFYWSQGYELARPERGYERKFKSDYLVQLAVL